ncbi:MAG: hypothetical protein ACK4TL_06355 [Hyphomicrobiaceae bacterium]
MMARPIHHFLKEFDSGEAPFQPPLPEPMPAPAVKAVTPALDTLAQRLQESYQQGVTAGRALEREAAEAQAAELAVDFERRLEDARSTFSAALADALAAELRAGIESARARLSSHVATVLVPFLRDGLTRAAIDSFVKELGNMIDTTEGLSVEVACPKEIIELLRERLGEAMAARGAPPGSVRCIPGDAADIRVTLNETVIETRLADWLARLEGVLR